MMTAGSYLGEATTVKTNESYKKFYIKDGVLKGCIIIGNCCRGGIYTDMIRGGNASMGIASNVQNATSGIEPAEGVSFISQNGQTVDYGAQSVFFNIRAYTCDVNSSSYKESVSTATAAKGVLPEDTEMVDSLPEVRINDISLGGQDTASVNGALTASLDGANGAQTPVQSLPAKFDLRETGDTTGVNGHQKIGVKSLQSQL